MEQSEKLRNELAQTEKALEELKSRSGLSSVADQKRIVLERMGFFQKDMEQAAADLEISFAKIKKMKEMLGQMPEFNVAQNISGFPNVAADGMRQKLYELQLKEQDLLSRYTEKNFVVKEVQRQIQNAQEILAKEQPIKAQVTKALNTTREQTKQALATEERNHTSYQAKTTALSITLANLREGLKAMNKSEIEIVRLQRDQEIQEANYREYSKKVEQARMDNALETRKISNISIVQAATLPVMPDSSPKTRNLALGIAFACFGAIALAFLLENLDHSFKRPEDVERQLDLPVLATIPLLSSGGVSSEFSKLTPPMLIPESVGGSDTLDEVGEGYEKLCDSLVQQELLEGQQLLAVTSCHNDEGVSMVAANLAATLARKANQRILLVEANPYRPSAHLTFGLNNSPGLTDPMATEEGGNTGRIKRAADIKLDVLPSGMGGITLARLLDSPEFQEQLNLWKSEYSFVVFDLPPIFKSNSVLRLASQLDGVVLVLEAESVSWEVARRAKRLLSQYKAKIIGVVFNKRKFHIPPWIYRKL
jgi:Mrp family chromosome partitioning ATPase